MVIETLNFQFIFIFYIFEMLKEVLLEESNFLTILMFRSEHICCLSVVKEPVTEIACA